MWFVVATFKESYAYPTQFSVYFGAYLGRLRLGSVVTIPKCDARMIAQL
jgi:hypothetical protein